MEEESVGVTYNKLVVSKAGDFIVHMSHMVYSVMEHSSGSASVTIPITNWDEHLSGWDLGDSVLQLVT